MSMNCPECGGPLIRTSRCYDSDGIRKGAYCEECHILFGVHAHGYSVQKGVDWRQSEIESSIRQALSLMTLSDR